MGPFDGFFNTMNWGGTNAANWQVPTQQGPDVWGTQNRNWFSGNGQSGGNQAGGSFNLSAMLGFDLGGGGNGGFDMGSLLGFNGGGGGQNNGLFGGFDPNALTGGAFGASSGSGVLGNIAGLFANSGGSMAMGTRMPQSLQHLIGRVTNDSITAALIGGAAPLTAASMIADIPGIPQNLQALAMGGSDFNAMIDHTNSILAEGVGAAKAAIQGIANPGNEPVSQSAALGEITQVLELVKQMGEAMKYLDDDSESAKQFRTYATNLIELYTTQANEKLANGIQDDNANMFNGLTPSQMNLVGLNPNA